VKTIIEYGCEICGRRYSAEADAKACESRGLAPTWPVGMLFANGYKDIVFAIAKPRPQKERAHWYEFSCWAWRDTNAGDNNVDSRKFCGLSPDISLPPPSMKLPATARAIQQLRAHGITPTILRNGVAEEIDETEVNP